MASVARVDPLSCYVEVQAEIAARDLFEEDRDLHKNGLYYMLKALKSETQEGEGMKPEEVVSCDHAFAKFLLWVSKTS